MRIDPVYLVAPEPQPPSMPTRRAFLMAAGALVVGAGGGGACGYSMGVAAAGEVGQAGVPAEPLETSGDAQLDQLRFLAVRAPIDDLFKSALQFLHARGTDYPQDKVLWQGVERLVVELRDNPGREADESLLVLLAAVIEGPAHPDEPSLGRFVPMLRQRRQVLRRR